MNDSQHYKSKIETVRDILRVLPVVYKMRSEGYNWKGIGRILDDGAIWNKRTKTYKRYRFRSWR